MSRVNVKVERGATFHFLPLFHLRAQNLRAYARKNCATVEIDLHSEMGQMLLIDR